MSKKEDKIYRNSAVRSKNSGTFTVGREGFASISAVEGIVLTPEMREMQACFDRDGLSNEERRRHIFERFAPTTR